MALRVLSFSDIPACFLLLGLHLVLVPDPKPTPVRIAFSISRVILEAIYWKRYTHRMRSGDKTRLHCVWVYKVGELCSAVANACCSSGSYVMSVAIYVCINVMCM